MATQDDFIRTALRVPPGLHAQIHEAAKVNNRTFNAEIVARLEGSFQIEARSEEQAFREGFEIAGLRIEVDRLRDQLHAERMRKFEDRASADTTGKLLESLPRDLVSQYGLHLYREQLDRIRQQAEAARLQYQQMHEELQRLLSSEAPPGPKSRANEAVSKLSKRIQELEEQARVTEQTISGIHTYREVYGLPELRNVVKVSSAVRVAWGDHPEVEPK